MIKINLIPLKGIQISSIGAINLGIPKKDVLKKLGNPSQIRNNDFFYWDLESRFDFDEYGNLEFIEFLFGPNPVKTEIEIYGINPFQTQSSNLLKLLENENKGEIDDSEKPYCYTFKEISIGVWRDISEEDIIESITEMKLNNEFEMYKDNVLEDLEKSKFFWTLGLGRKNYYRQ